MGDAGDAQEDPAPASGESGSRSYWGDRLGQQPRPDAWPPAPGPRDTTAGPGSPAQAPEAGARWAAPAPRQRVPRGAPQGPYDSGYRPPNSRKNWLIGAATAVIVAAAIFVPVFVINSGVKTLFASLGALPSSGDNTIAWYWGGNPFAGSNAARQLNVSTDQRFTTVIASTQGGDDADYLVALDKQGTAYIWGTPNGAKASLVVTTHPTPVAMPPGVRFTSISTNDGYVLALDQAGHLWNWGNVFATGPTTPPPSAAPVALPAPAGVTFTAISAGWNYSLALDATGHAWSWGNDGSDDLGLTTESTPVTAPMPVNMPPGVRFTTVAAGLSTSVALDSDGRAWAWGDNTEGELGVNFAAVLTTGAGACGQNASCSDTPVLVNTPPNVRLTSIAAGDFYEAAVDSTGRIWTWGTNDYGALGLAGLATTCAEPTACTSVGPPQATNSVPMVVPAPPGVHFVAVAVTQGEQQGEDATIALDSRGVAWAWGTNLILQFTTGTGACFTQDNESQSLTAGVGICLLTPSELDRPAGVTFKAVAASTQTLLGFPR
jgi:alpha-tubulin suppressor-like RCC1 family protein